MAIGKSELECVYEMSRQGITGSNSPRRHYDTVNKLAKSGGEDP
jgi:hypothetical protein